MEVNSARERTESERFFILTSLTNKGIFKIFGNTSPAPAFGGRLERIYSEEKII